MKHTLRVLGALLSIAPLLADSSVTPTLALRSQGRHADRQKWAGQAHHINMLEQQSYTRFSDDYKYYGTWDIGLAYMSSFRNNRLAHCLFGNDIVCADDIEEPNCCAQHASNILVQGSDVENRNPKAWLAEYFYLNCEYDGGFSIKPLIQNIMIDLDFYVGLDKAVAGMYFRIYGPITWTKWQTQFQAHDPETASSFLNSCGQDSAGYFTPLGNEIFLNSIAQYFKGISPKSVNGVIFEPLNYAQLISCNQSKVGFADLRAELGWNFYQGTNYHVGLNIQAAAPTGNRRSAQYVMEPIVGNGHHWELGGGISAHYEYICNHERTRFGVYFDANITHLFKSTETRTFDLKGKNNSRYMLATQFTNNVYNFNQTPGLVTAQLSGLQNAGIFGERTPVLFQFNSIYSPIANLTTTPVSISIPVQADIVAFLNITHRNTSFDIGYDFWARSCEQITPNGCGGCGSSLLSTANQNTWGLKGDARMFGFFLNNDGTGVIENTPIALSATQSQATIHQGTNKAAITEYCYEFMNCGVDKSQFSIAGTTPRQIADFPADPLDPYRERVQIKTSVQPIFLSADDVSFVATRGLSNKIFTNVTYTWNEREKTKPYLGIGGSAEFGASCSCEEDETCITTCEDISCSPCVECSVSQWTVWIKGGCTF